MVKFVGVRLKTYAYLMVDDSDIGKPKEQKSV